MESLVGSVNRTTNSVNVNHITMLYTTLVESLQSLDFTDANFTRQVRMHIRNYVHNLYAHNKIIHA